MSGIPGPSSLATITMPHREPRWAAPIEIRPSFPYSMMFRASSEMAVAMSVRSDPEKPRRWARLRPSWRAATMSAAVRIRTSTGAGGPTGLGSRATRAARLVRLVQVGEAFLEVEGGRDILECEAELDHGEGHFRLDADDDRLGSTKPKHVSDRS